MTQQIEAYNNKYTNYLPYISSSYGRLNSSCRKVEASNEYSSSIRSLAYHTCIAHVK